MSHFHKQEIADRFIRYASIFTQSEEGVADTPSTDCQRDLARVLYQELLDMGASDVSFDEEKCYVYATVPANIPADAAAVAARSDAASKKRENLAPIIGLMAHMDTSNAVDGRGHGVHPRKIDAYDGSVVILNEEAGYKLDPSEFPDLTRHEGETLIVTDGLSVLGGDDKAGVTQIMEVVDFYLHHPEIAHGTIRVCFTPDEEVGNGVMNIDLSRFAVDYGYTVDGSRIGELEYENFNAASCHVIIHGKSTHPGDAKGVMINALLVGMDFNAMLPAGETPYDTEGYEGFYHLEDMKGGCDHAELDYIIRDHDRAKFEVRKETVQKICDALNEKYGAGTVEIKVKDSYYNMAEKVAPHMHLIENAKAAMAEMNVVPKINPIRGGTDGCQLSYMGVPCPNLGTGAYNYHSRFEYVSADEMELGAEIVLRILNKYAAFELDQ